MTLATKKMSRENLLKLKEGDTVVVSRFNNKPRVEFVVTEIVDDSSLFIKDKNCTEIMIDTIRNCMVEPSGCTFAGVYICEK